MPIIGYHWLLLATTYLVGDDREFEVLGIFRGVITILVEWKSQKFKDPSLLGFAYYRLPLATTGFDKRNLKV